ncbi:SIR2 family protein [Methylocaldum gracile]|uniref:SIR2 family protein n=1 Tax=Methylocaldum sp. 0917 TaxID=2485163 RepID=UPI001AAD5A74
MIGEHLQIDEQEFLRRFAQHSPQLMWFLGAGSSRSAGLPTALDLIWDLKRRYYCAKENQDLQAHNVSNHAIRAKIQSYIDGKGFPAEWSPEEYSFYFKHMFGDDYDAQRSYIQSQLSPDKITLTIGQRALAALLAMGRTRLIFTTNFDNVVEFAYAEVTNKNLDAFHLEGSYAALDALNAEAFPLYAKIHGDFRYRSIKNLPSDLLDNDTEIQKCFIAAAGRYGLVVAGYSGRDANVMAMMDKALEQPNPFPHGIWWTTPDMAGVAPAVVAFIEGAKSKGLSAHVVETDPFDVMLSKIWRQIPDKPQALDQKVRSARAKAVSIPLPRPGRDYPILRTNAVEVIDTPRVCGRLPANGLAAADLFAAVRERRPDAIVSYQDGIIFWGNSQQVAASLEGLVADINDAPFREFADPIADIAASTYLKSFFEHGIVEAICSDKPVLLRKKGRSYYAIVNSRRSDDPRFASLKNAIRYLGSGSINGAVPSLPETFWSEAVRLNLDERGGRLWLLLEPDIWISPLTQRENAREFLRERKLKRFNNRSSNILDAWIEILLGIIGQGQAVSVSYMPDSDYPAAFNISTRTAFSRRG